MKSPLYASPKPSKTRTSISAWNEDGGAAANPTKSCASLSGLFKTKTQFGPNRFRRTARSLDRLLQPPNLVGLKNVAGQQQSSNLSELPQSFVPSQIPHDAATSLGPHEFSTHLEPGDQSPRVQKTTYLKASDLLCLILRTPDLFIRHPTRNHARDRTRCLRIYNHWTPAECYRDKSYDRRTLWTQPH